VEWAFRVEVKVWEDNADRCGAAFFFHLDFNIILFSLGLKCHFNSSW
jgi:hypothetical protein